MLRGVLRGIKDLIYPDYCLSCGNKIISRAGQAPLCPACRCRIEENTPPLCVSCGRQLTGQAPGKNLCRSCLKRNFSFDRAFSPCKYEGVVKKLIHEFKYSGKDYLGKFLGKILRDFTCAHPLPVGYIDLVIPVPLHKDRLREREFNQAHILSESVAGVFGRKTSSGILMRKKPTRTQTELGFAQRQKNIKGSFAADGSGILKGSDVLLVDDVLTTGATASEAAKTLKEAGAKKVYVLTLSS